MRFLRTIVLAVVALLAWSFGPWVLLLGAATLAVPRVRSWLRPTRRTVAVWAGVVVGLAGLVLLVPDGWLPMPPAPGALVSPSYAGRPFQPRPMDLPATGDASQPDVATTWRGPLGESPDVDTAWSGLDHCPRWAVDRLHRLVGVCGGPGGRRSLRVVDPGSLHVAATKDLPGGSACAGSDVALDDQGRAVVATADRRLLVVATADADGDADLTTVASHDLRDVVPADDCLVSVQPAGGGRLWWATAGGRVGVVDGGTGRVRAIALGEEVTEPVAVDASGAFVVTTHALHRLLPGPPGGRPQVVWRAPYDRGSARKPGQSSQGSGTTPVVLPGGLVAITDNADPQMHVEVYRAATGDLVCRQPVFGDDAGATGSALVPVGSGVVVSNNHGYGGPLATVLGRTTTGGLARVDVSGGRCSVRWTSDEVSPSVVPALSAATGLLYTWTKPHSWWGADAWFLTAIDVRTGRTAFRVRGGLGWWRDSAHGAVTLAPDGTAYVATLGGLVRVRDRAGAVEPGAFGTASWPS